MKVDYCIILSAGFGTRMKSIGQSLPKPLWPIFEKSIIELQIDYARMLGVKNIYVNLHYHFNQILNYFHTKPEYDDINFLIEEEILDIGGAIHNLASQKEVNYKGHLMVLNGDQFVFFDFSLIENAIKLLNQYKSVLMAVKVDSRFGHSETQLNNNFELEKIIPNSEIIKAKEIYTYSGMSFIDLSKLERIQGAISLYDSVVTYKKDPVKMVDIKDYKYWDFGTIDRYWNSMFDSLDKVDTNDEFMSFLIENNGFDLSKFRSKNKSYNSETHSINLDQKEHSLEDGQIVINSKRDSNSSTKKGIYYKELFEEVNFIQKD